MRTSLRFILPILLLCTLANNNYGQQPEVKFERYSLEQGLSQSAVYAIIQDRQGFLWFSTEDGLDRYDGYNFAVFKHKPQDQNSLSSSVTGAMLQDHNGLIWISTTYGLNCYDPQKETFTHYFHNADDPQSISSNFLNGIYEDKDGYIWIGSGSGLNRFDPKTKKFKTYFNDPNNPDSISSNIVGGAIDDGQGNLWIGTTNGGLEHLDRQTEKFHAYRHNPNDPHSLSSNSITALFRDHNGVLWVGTGNGLNRFNPADQSFEKYFADPGNPNSISGNNIFSIYEDNNGYLWVGTLGNGVNRFDPVKKIFTSYKYDLAAPDSLSKNDVGVIFQDRSGTLWFGTRGGGVNKLKTQLFTTYRHDAQDPNSISSNFIRAILEDSKGNLWIATEDRGVNRYLPNHQGLKNYLADPHNPKSLSSNTVRVVFEDSEGIIWMGTAEGLDRLDPVTDTFTAYRNDPDKPTSISQNYILTIEEDNAGNLWIGTINGLNRYDKKTDTFHRYLHDPKSPRSLAANIVRSIFKDSEGILWISTTGGGVNKYDPASDSFITYANDPANPNSISDNNVLSVREDSKGNLWVGTVEGIDKFDKKTGRFQTFSEKDGLSSHFAYGALEDKEGNLWISTNKGLSKFNPVTNIFKNYDVSDGLQSNEFNGGSFFKSRSGEFFFGGINGYNRFYPEQIKENSFIPPVVITSFSIMGQQIGNARFNPGTRINEKLLELSYKENFFAFEFSALSFTHSEKNQYKYKMEGFDNDWHSTGTRRFVSYTNLDPGDYVFRVQGSNNDGVWNEEGVAIKIRIVPPLWKTWWAYLLYLCALTSIGYGGMRYRLNAIDRRNQLEKAAAIGKKNEELEKKNLELEVKHLEILKKNEELIESNNRADKIFSALADALPGTVLDGKYRLDEKIGSGGFGAVYRATHLAMKRPIAVKIFKPMPGNDSVKGLERFQFEAVSACRINHPNAVTVLDSGVSSEGIAYLVMELLEGHTLTAELRETKSIPVMRAAAIILPICEVLAKAHATGIVHRDIKPENIFLHRGPDGEEIVKVVDFGIAKLLDSQSGGNMNLTGTGGLVGTPIYMAPERFSGKNYDGRSDVYSVGILFFEMLIGHAPFLGGAGGFPALVMDHVATKPPAVTTLNPAIPQEIEEMIFHALEKDPNNRPLAFDFAQRLADFLGVGLLSRTTGNLRAITLNQYFNDRKTADVGVPHTSITPIAETDPLEKTTLEKPNNHT